MKIGRNTLFKRLKRNGIEIRSFLICSDFIGCEDKKCLVFVDLHQPDTNCYRFTLAKTAKEFGAKAFVLLHLICLHASDKAFNTGESVTSTYFANLISGFVDTLID
jgi:ribose-phosphate pyrophosphokinase